MGVFLQSHSGPLWVAGVLSSSDMTGHGVELLQFSLSPVLSDPQVLCGISE